jgi:hypothetical protein
LACLIWILLQYRATPCPLQAGFRSQRGLFPAQRGVANHLTSAHPRNIIQSTARVSVSNSEMRILCSEQGRTRVYAEAYFSYVAGENPRRTPLRGKRAIYGWKLTKKTIGPINQGVFWAQALQHPSSQPLPFPLNRLILWINLKKEHTVSCLRTSFKK